MATVSKTITLVSGVSQAVTLSGAFKRRNLRIRTVSGTAVDLWVTYGPTTPTDPAADQDDATFVNAEMTETVDGFEINVPEADKSVCVVRVLGVGAPKLQVLIY